MLTDGRMPRIASGGDRYCHEAVSRMAGDAGRLVVERQEFRNWPIPAEPATEELRCQQELGKGTSEGEGNAGRRGSDAQAVQGDGPGCVQAVGYPKSSTLTPPFSTRNVPSPGQTAISGKPSSVIETFSVTGSLSNCSDT